MCLYRLSGLPVVEAGRLVGFVAEKDVLSRLFPDPGGFPRRHGRRGLRRHGSPVPGRHASEDRRHHVHAGDYGVSPEMHALQAASTMVRHNFRRIPVVTGDTLEGMVSLGDVHKALFHANLSQR
jgi:CBS domain-containing protein